jgi:8-oxo-dGTP diphosphatase
MIVGTNGVVVDESGRALLIRRDDVLTWALPGGALEPGELPPDGVIREVREETGLQVEPERLTGLYYWTTQHSAFLIFVFLCRPVHGRLRRTREALQVGYYRPDRLPWPMLSTHRLRIDQAMAEGAGQATWVRQRPSRWFGLAHMTIGRLIYRWQDFQLKRLGLPPYQPPQPWRYGAFSIIHDGGRVLWVKRTDHDVWNLPGGQPTPGEPPWDTAVRETQEETGLSVRLTQLSGVYLKPADHSLIFSFMAEVDGGRLTLGPEAEGFDYFAPGEEPANSLPKQVERVADAHAPETATCFRIQDGPPGLVQLGLEAQ